MKKKMFVVYVLILAIFIFNFTGCNSTKEEDPAKTVKKQTGEVTKRDASKGEPAPDPKEGVEMPRFIVFKGGFGTGLQLDLDTEAVTRGIRKVYPDINIRIMPGGSKAGTERVASGECDMGVAGPDYPYWFTVGDSRGGYKEPTPDKLYCLFNLPSGMKLTWVVDGDSDIKTVADLKDKRINVAGPGTAAEACFFPGILKAEGLSYEDIEKNGGLIHRGNMSGAMEMLAAGQLDAVAVSQPHPSALVQEYCITHDARFISFTNKQLEMATNAKTGSIGYLPGAIPSEHYDWLKEDVKTGWMLDTITVSADMPDDVVYNLLCAIWGEDRYKQWGDIHPSMKGIQYLDEALTGLPIPLHPGAVQFWEDWGVEIPKSHAER